MYGPPRNTNGAIMEPVLTPVTSLNCGSVPDSDQPQMSPAPNAPSPPPPETARKYAGGRGASGSSPSKARSRWSDCSHSATIAGPCVSYQAQKRPFGRPSTVASSARSAGTGAKFPTRGSKRAPVVEYTPVATTKTIASTPSQAKVLLPRRREPAVDGSTELMRNLPAGRGAQFARGPLWTKAGSASRPKVPESDRRSHTSGASEARPR